jgi:hypothetical protein
MTDKIDHEKAEKLAQAAIDECNECDGGFDENDSDCKSCMSDWNLLSRAYLDLLAENERLKHSLQHAIWALEEHSIDSSALMQGECLYKLRYEELAEQTAWTAVKDGLPEVGRLEAGLAKLKEEVIGELQQAESSYKIFLNKQDHDRADYWSSRATAFSEVLTRLKVIYPDPPEREDDGD